MERSEIINACVSSCMKEVPNMLGNVEHVIPFGNGIIIVSKPIAPHDARSVEGWQVVFTVSRV